MVLKKPHVLASPLSLPLALWGWYVVSLSLFLDPSGFDLFQVAVPCEEIESGRARRGSPNEW